MKLRPIVIIRIILLVVLIPLTYLTFCRSSPKEVISNARYITADRVVTRDCGVAPCEIWLYKPKGTTKYKSVAVLNPGTQTFQARIYVTSAPTFGFVDGIAYLGSADYMETRSTEPYTVANAYDYGWEYRSWYWGSFFWDALLVGGILLLIILIILFIDSIFNIFETGVEFLGTKKGKKFLGKLDKDIRRRK